MNSLVGYSLSSCLPKLRSVYDTVWILAESDKLNNSAVDNSYSKKGKVFMTQ